MNTRSLARVAVIAIIAAAGAARAGPRAMEATGPDTLPPGGCGVFHVEVGAGGAAGERARVSLRCGVKKTSLGQARIDDSGRARVVTCVPARTVEGICEIAVAVGRAARVLPLYIKAIPDLLLSSDRVLYRPGQQVHLRVLALERTLRRPLPGRAVTISLEDLRGSTLLRERVRTDAFGVAATSVPLSRQVRAGEYLATAAAAPGVVRRKLRVEEYEVPRFVIDVSPARTFARPGERLAVAVKARYGHGAPIAGGRAEITVARLAGRQGRRVSRTRVPLDASGAATVQVTAPAGARAGRPEVGVHLGLEVAVVDPAGHREVKAATIPVSVVPLLLGAHWLHPPLVGAPSRIAVSLQRPDGAPVDGQITLTPPGGAAVQIETGADGIAVTDLRLREPGHVDILARGGGARVSTRLKVDRPAPDAFGVVVRRPVITPGSAVDVELRAQRTGGSIRLLLKMGRSILQRRTIPVDSRQERVTLSIPPGFKGLATVAAFRGDRVAQARILALADPGLDVKLSASPGSAGPGDEVTLSLNVRDRRGRPAAAAVELAVLDGGIHTLGGQGLSGREPWFSTVSRATLDALASGGSWADRTTSDLIRDPAFQEAMAFRLGALPMKDSWEMAPGPSPIRRAAAPPPWLRDAAALLRRLPGASPSPAHRRLLTLAGPALGLLIFILWIVGSRGRRRGWLRPLFLMGFVLALVMVALVQWSRGPRLDPLPAVSHGGALQPRAERLVSALSDPRRFTGLPRQAFERDVITGSSEVFPPGTGAVLQIDARRITVDGEVVARLRDFELSLADLRDGKDSYLITPLLERLQRNTADLQLATKISGRRSLLLMTVVADPATPSTLLVKVLYTAGQAEVDSYTVITPDELEVTAPRSVGPAGGPTLWLLLLLAVLLLLIRQRCRLPAYLSFVALSACCGLHAMLRAFPFDQQGSTGFPLEEGLVGLQLWVIGLVAVALLWETLAARRVPPTSVAAMALALGLLSVPLSRDFALYYRIPHHRALHTPRYGGGAAREVSPSFPRAPRAVRPLVGAPTRWHFPDTLMYRPLLITDASGEASVKLRLGHQLTTWRATALASARSGAMGLGRARVLSWKGLQVEVELPPRVSAGDRLETPISVYNHTAGSVRVALKLDPAGWFDQLDPREVAVDVGAGSGALAFLPIRIRKPGSFRLGARASAVAGEGGDAVARPIEVVSRSGYPVSRAASVALTAGQRRGQARLRVPAGLVPGSGRLTVTRFPDLLATLDSGIAGMLKMPTGCAEQTISSTLPNVMLLEALPHLAATRPDLARRARDNALRGLQRLSLYERPGGGFSLFGRGAADPWLSAHGLQLLAALRRTLGVGQEMLSRTARFVTDAMTKEKDPAKLAAILRSVAFAARGGTLPAVRLEATRAVNELTDRATRSAAPYFVALVAGALQDLNLHRARSARLAARLDAMGRRDRRGGVSWPGPITAGGSRFESADIETTALVTMVLARAKRLPRAREGLTWLLSRRGASGAWLATHDSLRAISALLEYLRSREPAPRSAAAPTCSVNGRPAAFGVSGAGSTGVSVQDVTDGSKPGDNLLTATGGGQEVMCTLSFSGLVSWDRAAARRPAPLRLDLSYSKTRVQLGEQIFAELRVSNSGYTAKMPIIRYHLPPGFQIDRGDLQRLVDSGKVKRFEEERSNLLFYLAPISKGQTWTSRLPIRGRTPVEGSSQGAMIHDYYYPSNVHIVKPTPLEVFRRTLPDKGVPSPVAKGPRWRQLSSKPFELHSALPRPAWAGPKDLSRLSWVRIHRWYDPPRSRRTSRLLQLFPSTKGKERLQRLQKILDTPGSRGKQAGEAVPTKRP